jgi:hypothetical protein
LSHSRHGLGVGQRTNTDEQPAMRPCWSNELGLVHVECVDRARRVAVRGKPGFNKQHTARLQVAIHRGDGRVQPLDRHDVTDRAEQAHHRVKGMSEVELNHIGMVEGQLRVSLASDREQVRVEIQTFRHVVVLEVGQMTAGAAGHIQQRLPLLRTCVLISASIRSASPA